MTGSRPAREGEEEPMSSRRKQQNKLRSGPTWLAAAAVVILIAAGCTAPAPTGGSRSSRTAPSTEKKLTSLEVLDAGDTWLIRMEGGGAATWTLFQLSDPERLVLDLRGVDVSSLAPATKVNNGTLTDIAVSEVVPGSIGQVVIGLEQDLPYEAFKKDNALVVRVLKSHEKARKRPSAPAPSAPPLASSTQPAPKEAGAVTISKIEYIDGKDFCRVKITADAPFEREISYGQGGAVTVFSSGANLTGQALDQLLISEFPGPVSEVQSTMEERNGSEGAQIEIRLKAEIPPRTGEKNLPGGYAFFMDFPKKQLGEPILLAQADAADDDSLDLEGLDEEEPAGSGDGQGEADGDVPEEDIGESTGIEGFESILEGKEEAIDFSTESKYTGTKINMDFREADIRDVLQLIADVSGLNIISGEDVEGTVSIKLENVPWDQALDIIMETNGFDKKVMGNVIRVAPAAVLAQEEEDRLLAIQKKDELQPLHFKIVPVNYADAAELQEKIQDILSPRGNVTVDERTNSLLIKDIPKAIEQAINTIRALDTQTAQVMIESRIVVTKLNFTQEVGIQWAGNMQQSTVNGNNFGNYVAAEDWMVDLPVSTIGTRAGQRMGFSFGRLSKDFNIDLVLSASEQSGLSKIISSPRVTVLDNREAKIVTGVSLPVRVYQSGTVTVIYKDAFLSITVTPQITSDNAVILKLLVTDNTFNEALSSIFGDPAINKNEAQTELLVRDGETTVIGGIVQVSKADAEYAVPFLNKVPFLGFFFRTNKKNDEREEILIFVTPNIVKS